MGETIDYALEVVRIFVHDWERTLAFYGETLGLEEQVRLADFGWASFGVGGAGLAVERPAPSAPGVTRAQSWACARTLWRLTEESPARALRVRADGEGWAIEDGDGGRWPARERTA